MVDQNRTIHLSDEAATIRFGTALATDLSGGGIVCFFGGLGAGKTALVRAIIHQLQRDAGQSPEEIPSPTYTLLQTYDAGDLSIWHYDMYRIEKPDDVYELSWEDALADGLILIEWPEQLGPYIPIDRLDIHLSHCEGLGRDLRLEAQGNWIGRALHAAP